MSDLRYPIGQFDLGAAVDPRNRGQAIDDIAVLPARMRAAIQGLDDPQLDTPYRPGGWTVRQLVHHVADSHMNGFTRAKLALTEDAPTIKPYDENAFAGLADMQLPVEPSLQLLEGLHARWVVLYRSIRPEQFARAFFHPEHQKTLTLDGQLQGYSWHSRHHVAHITALRQRQGW
jgi:hypothetical protein